MDNVIEFPSGELEAKGPAPSSEITYAEPYPAPEFFAADLARIHAFGPIVRLVFTTPEIVAEAGQQNVAVCRLVIPKESVSSLIGKLQASIATPEQQG